MKGIQVIGALALYVTSLMGCGGYEEIRGPRYDEMNVPQTPTLEMRANVVRAHVMRQEMHGTLSFGQTQYFARAQDLNEDITPDLIVEGITLDGTHIAFVDMYPMGSLDFVQYRRDGELVNVRYHQTPPFARAYESALIVLQTEFQDLEMRRDPRFEELLQEALE